MSYKYTHFFSSHQQTPDASACGAYSTELEVSRQRQRCHTHTEKGDGVTLTSRSPQPTLQQNVLPLRIILLILNVKDASGSRVAILLMSPLYPYLTGGFIAHTQDSESK